MRKEGDIKYILLCLFEDMSETSTLVSDSKESHFKSEKVSLKYLLSIVLISYYMIQLTTYGN